MTSKVSKLFVIGAYKRSLQNETKLKNAKKGLLIKICHRNKGRTNVLSEILAQTNDLNTINSKNFKNNNIDDSSATKTANASDDEYLKKFYQTPNGGPKHSIAINRAHHLTSFLTEYILNAFSSGYFEMPEIAKFKLETNCTEDFVFEISKIELCANLSALKVYWLNSGNQELDSFVEDFLDKKLRSQIRQTLSSERIMSYVPRVVFLRDETNANLKRIDSYMAQIKLENSSYDSQQQDSHESADEKNNDKEESNEKNHQQVNAVKKNSINNLYGVDFNQFLEKIKTGTGSDCIKWSKEVEKSESAVAPLINSGDLNAKSKFEQSLKAFQINRRIKNEKLNRSAIFKLSLLELEKEKEAEQN